jgi:flagellar basal-body rod protein FlgC
MSISSVASVSGMMAAQMRQTVSAHNVANVNTPGYQELAVRQSEIVSGGVQISSIARVPSDSPDFSGTDLTEEVVNQIGNKDSFAANARVLKVQDSMIGTLLDMKA